MPFTTYQSKASSPFVIEAEANSYKLRLFSPSGERIGSLDVTTIGSDTARVTDLTLIHPHTVTKALLQEIRLWLKEQGGYKNIKFERVDARHQAAERVLRNRKQTL